VTGNKLVISQLPASQMFGHLQPCLICCCTQLLLLTCW